jgi:hypothetical protein
MSIAQAISCEGDVVLRYDTHWWFPWHYFSGGMKIRRAGAVLRLSFGTPANMRFPMRLPGIPAPGTLQQLPAVLKDVSTMRGLGGAWREALSRTRRNDSAS